MTALTQTDLARFFKRYDVRNRLLFAGALCASLALSAVMIAHGLDITGAPAKVAAAERFSMIFAPAVTLAWWGVMELLARWRDGRVPVATDDIRDGLRIANAGFLFNVAMIGVALGTQAVMALGLFGHPVGDLVPRATIVAMGIATACLGNVWPRLRTRPASEPKTARELKVNRVWGWIMVILGLGMILLGVFLPFLYPVLRSLHS